MTALAARDSVPTTVDVGPVILSDAGAERRLLRRRRGPGQHGEAQRRPPAASVEIQPVGGVVVIAVTDDGVGGASTGPGPRPGRPGRPAVRRRRDPDGDLAGRWADPADGDPPQVADPGPLLRPVPRATPASLQDRDRTPIGRDAEACGWSWPTTRCCSVRGWSGCWTRPVPTWSPRSATRPRFLARRGRAPARRRGGRHPDAADDDRRRAAGRGRGPRPQPELAVLMLSAYVEKSYADVLLRRRPWRRGLSAQGPGGLAGDPGRRAAHDRRRRHRARSGGGGPAAGGPPDRSARHA